MKRRTKWIIGLGAGIPVLLIVGVLIVLLLFSPNPENDLSSIETKALPSIGTQETAPAAVEDATDVGNRPAVNESESAPVVEGSVSMEELEPVIVPPPTIDTFGLPFSGTLVMVGDKKPFGEEAFELAIEGESVVLRSTGKFWFKALIATITLDYDQILEMDSYLRPMMLASTFDAPLGFGMDIQAEFNDEGVIIRSGKDVEEVSVDPESALVRGTFGTYAIIPLLYQLREIEGEITLETLVFGGPPNRDNTEADGLPETTISQIEDTTIQFGDRQLIVSQYQISGDMGTMTLFALGVEMLGLLAGNSEESLFVYRADYFEDGFVVGN